MLQRSLRTLLHELSHGPLPEAAFVLNAGDQGLLRSLETLPAAAASQRIGTSSVAAHVDHLRYGFELLNRWSRGESPFADADFAASWRRLTVSEEEWRARRDQLRKEIEAWSVALQRAGDWTETDLTVAIGSIVHLAYHLGAIRQMHPVLHGPKDQ